MISLQPVILEALRRRTIVNFEYRGKLVRAEPYEIGITNDGRCQLSALEFGVTSAPIWRSLDWFEIRRVVDTGEEYEGTRPAYNSEEFGLSQIERRYQYSKPPHFDLSLVPTTEHESVRLLLANLAELQRHVENFLAAVELVDFCRHHFSRNQAQAIQWMKLAGRDAIMTVHRFDEVRKALVAVCKTTPTIWNQVNKNALKSAGNQFCRNFPNAESYRDGIAHSGLRYSSKLKEQEHSVSKANVGLFSLEGEKLHVSDAISCSDTFISSWKGTTFSQRVHYHELYQLDAVKLALWRAFSPNEKYD